MSDVRIQSNSRSKCARRSIMFAPSSRGAPPATTRTGLPHVCPSMQKNVDFITLLHPEFHAKRSDPSALLRQGTHIGERLLYDCDDLLALFAFEFQSRSFHSFRISGRDVFGQLDVLNELH